MPRILVAASPALACLMLAAACSNPVGPTSSATLDRFVQALRQQGLTVTVGGDIPPEVNRFFSVPAHQVRVNNGQVNAFVYENAQTAAAEAALISEDGQPSPSARITWVSTPRFYRQGALIVLYVGCAAEIVQALQVTVGTPIAVGRTPCDVGG
jgi:hypothetical protein